MEAESRKEQTKLGATEEWRRAKSSNNKEIKSSFINRYFGTVKRTELEKDHKVQTEKLVAGTFHLPLKGKLIFTHHKKFCGEKT